MRDIAMNALAHKTVTADALDMGALMQSLGFVLRMAQVVSYERFFERFPDGEVFPGEFTVLWVIGLNPGIKQGDVAQALKIKRAHMTQLVKRMVKAELVQRQRSEHDRRSVLLSLTDKGHQEVSRWRKDFLTIDYVDGSNLTRKEHDELIALLCKYAGLEGKLL